MHSRSRLTSVVKRTQPRYCVQKYGGTRKLLRVSSFNLISRALIYYAWRSAALVFGAVLEIIILVWINKVSLRIVETVPKGTKLTISIVEAISPIAVDSFCGRFLCHRRTRSPNCNGSLYCRKRQNLCYSDFQHNRRKQKDDLLSLIQNSVCHKCLFYCNQYRCHHNRRHRHNCQSGNRYLKGV